MDVLKFAKEWIASWNSHNIEKIMAHYCDHVVFTCPYIEKYMGITGGTITSKAELKNYFIKGLEAFPDLKFELQMFRGNADEVTLYYKSINDMLAIEHMELNKQGKVKFGKVEYKM
jgi:SnoaL-like domain